MSEPAVPARMRDVIVVGGGCYGTFYATQLAKAKLRGKADYRTVVIVDRDERCRARLELPDAPDRTFVTSEWDGFFDRFLSAGRPWHSGEERDYVVPSPHMPHLMFEWLVRRMGGRRNLGTLIATLGVILVQQWEKKPRRKPCSPRDQFDG